MNAFAPDPALFGVLADINPLIIVFTCFPLVFAGMWCGVIFLLSMLGGWRDLAESFPDRGQPCDRSFRMQSGRLGFINYSSILTIHSGPQGLRVAVLGPFRLGHPSLFIPWSAIHNATTKRSLWMETVSFELGSPKIATLQLPKKIFKGRGVIG